MQSAHVSALETKHASLDREIHEESHRPQPDQERISTLKKRKLQIKQEIAAS